MLSAVCDLAFVLYPLHGQVIDLKKTVDNLVVIPKLSTALSERWCCFGCLT